MLKELENCNICPHRCNINRNKGKVGRCKATNKVKIALYSIHNFEEPCISGEKGSGTVFFSNCNLNCIFCQNYEISQLGKGKEISVEELAEIFLIQQEKEVENINLVTPTSYVPQIIEAIKIAKEKGLKIPIVYNTNGYESVETLKMLEGYIDVYLPDLKYAENHLAKEYSNVGDYFEVATKNNHDFYINFTIDFAYNIYLIDAIKFIYSKLKHKNKAFNLYIKVKDYFMNSKELLAILNENHFEFISKSQILAKDYFREIKQTDLFKNTKIIFNDPTTA